MDDHKNKAEADPPLTFSYRKEPEAAPPSRFVPMKLVMQPSGLTVELRRTDTVVGRHLEVDLRLPLPDVSRRHCRFLFADNFWQVLDLNSLNGVYVNGERVNKAILHHEDSIRIGGFTFKVDLHSSQGTVKLPSSPRLGFNPPKRQAS